MRLTYLAVVLLFFGCATEQYTYLEPIQAGSIIHRSLYSIEVPQSSPKDTRQWERYSRNGRSDDLVLKYSEGLVLPSYAASIEVKRQVQKIGSLAELISHVEKNPEYRSPAEFPKIQSQLLCVRPAVWIDAAPERPRGFFAHVLLCIDTKNHNYYDLKVSYMTTRKGDIPPEALGSMADQFFQSFRVEN